MKNYLSIMVLVFSALSGTLNLHAQSYNTGPQKEQINIIPPSPEAASLGKYGEIPLGYYTGTLNFNIPLTTFHVGSISLPLSLNYSSGEGIKVGEVANNIGLGWQLGGIGVITRAVMGRADDKGGFLTAINNYDRSFTNGPPNNNFDISTATAKLNDWYWASQYCIDLQPDIFYYNFNNYTGKFFFDWNGNIINMSNNPIKIGYNTDSNGVIIEWVITTEQGIKYIFSTTETTTEVDPISIHDQNCGYVNGPRTFNSSWYLSKIEDNNNNSIILTYEPYSYRLMDIKSQQVSVQDGSSMGMSNCSQLNTPHHKGDESLSYSINPTTYYQKRLKTISSSNGKSIILNYNTPRLDTISLQAISSFNSLDNVQLNYNSTLIKSWDLIHDYSTGRLTLTQLKENSTTPVTVKKYLFDYDHAIPKSIESYGIDHWGFYNNKTSNPSLVPSFTLNLILNPPNVLQIPYDGANREVDTTSCLYGLLTKITYPTGGSSEFTYEANKCGRVQLKPIRDYKLHPKKGEYYNAQATALSPGTMLQVSKDTFNITQTTTVEIEYSAYLNQHPCSPVKKPKLFLKKIDGGMPVIIRQKQFAYTIDSAIIGSYYENEFYELQPGVYELSAEATCYDLQEQSAEEASIAVNYEYEDTSVTFAQIPAGGARIKNIRTFDNFSNVTGQKDFYYNMPDSPNLSSGVIYGLPEYKTNKTSADVYHYCPPLEIPIVITPLELHLARNVFQLGTTNGSHIGYEYVTIISKNEGKKEFRYTSPALYPDDIDMNWPYMTPGSQAFKTGLLLSEKDYSWTNNAYHLVKKINNLYDFIDSGTVSIGVFFYGNREIGYNLINIWSPLSWANAYAKDMEYFFQFDSCKLNSGYPRLISQTDTFYYTSSLSTASENTYHPSIPQLLQSKETINSDNNISKIVYTYPSDLASSAIKTAMLDKNMISFPVTTKTYVNGTLTSTLKNNYDLFNGNQVALQSKQSSTYSNPLETEITYDKYDSHGNLLTYTTRQGISTVLLWGYKGAYPVAQIEHIDTAALTTYLAAHPSIQTTCDDPASDQALRDAVQQIRDNFPGAFITGMTYKPAVGLTSKTDENNVTTYYEYDSFSRLAYIKDADGNILKKITYMIDGQQ